MDKGLWPAGERFAVNLFKGMSQIEAYRDSHNYPAVISKATARVLTVKSSLLAHHPKVVARLKELQDQAVSAAIATVVERKIRLTEIIRANLVDFMDENGEVKVDKSMRNLGAIAEYELKPMKFGRRKALKLRDIVSAIQELNKMEHIYDSSTVINQDNRQVNIYVMDSETKELLSQLPQRTEKLAMGT